jgi:sugar lactone lactonase YvrE
MTNWKRIACALWVGGCSLFAGQAHAEEPAVVWELTEGVRAPESAYLEPTTGYLFLSQIGEGGGNGRDGDGWISRLTADGSVSEARWVTGLNAPKGLRSHHGVLWVSDIDQLVGIDIAKGVIAHRVPVEGAKFLNDVACGPDGSVYVTDMPASRIFRYRNGQVDVFAEGPELECPNGLLVDGGRLVLGGWGLGIKDDFSTEQLGRLLSLDLETRKVSAITPAPLGHLDGVERDGKGGFVVTDWRNGKVFHVRANGDAKLLLGLPQGTADHAYLVPEMRLILPRMLENRVTAYDLRGLLP